MYKQGFDPTPTEPKPLTPGGQGTRYADYAWDAAHSRIVAVQEKHPLGGGEGVVNSVVAIGGFTCIRKHAVKRLVRTGPVGSLWLLCVAHSRSVAVKVKHPFGCVCGGGGRDQLGGCDWWLVRVHTYVPMFQSLDSACIQGAGAWQTCLLNW